jgi:hypothetical protein
MRGMQRRLPAALAFLAVVVTYTWYSGLGFGQWSLRGYDDSYYSSLAEGFLHGRLSMMQEPDPRLAALADPWDARARADIPWLIDASYFQGRYYLYFSPLPVIVIYLPVRLVTGLYPSDAHVTLLFTIVSFAMWVAFVRRALGVPRETLALPFPLWIVILGVGNVVPFILGYSGIYRVPIACAMAFTAAWAYALLRLIESPSRSRVAWMGTFLALAIAARPNLVVLVAVALLAIWWSDSTRRDRVRLSLIALLPTAFVAIAMACYNYARFGSPSELGVSYLLTQISMQGRSYCSLCSWPELARMINAALQYVFTPPAIRSSYPFVMIQTHVLERSLNYPGTPEQVVGIAALNPFTIAGTLVAALLVLSPRPDARTRAAALVILAGWIVLLALSTCAWITARYELDFMGLLVVGAVVACEIGAARLVRAGVSMMPIRIALALIGCYAVLGGLLLEIPTAARALR